MMCNPRVFDDVEPNGYQLTGITDAMVARLPPNIDIDEASVAKALLRDGWTPGFIAEQLDAVMERIRLEPVNARRTER